MTAPLFKSFLIEQILSITSSLILGPHDAALGR
jgi:hypothetical protein